MSLKLEQMLSIPFKYETSIWIMKTILLLYQPITIQEKESLDFSDRISTNFNPKNNPSFSIFYVCVLLYNL